MYVLSDGCGNTSCEPWLHVSCEITDVVCELARLGNLLANSFLFLRSRGVGLNLQQHDDALVNLKVSDGEVISASNPLFIMTFEAGVQEWDHLVEVAVKLLVISIIDGDSIEWLEAQDKTVIIVLLHKVHERVDLPGCIRVGGVHAVTDSEHAQNSAGLGDGDAILLPDGQGAERQVLLHGREVVL